MASDAPMRTTSEMARARYIWPGYFEYVGLDVRPAVFAFAASQRVLYSNVGSSLRISTASA